METAQVVICQSCQSEFNGYEKMPMILPCRHHLCYTCIIDYFSKNKSIRCVKQGCQQVHSVHPTRLNQDEKMLSFIEQRGFSKIVSLLQNQEASVKLAHGQLVEQQTNFIQQVMKHINSFVFSDSLQLQKELKQIEKDIKYYFNQLRIVQRQKNQQQKQLLIQQIGQINLPMEQKIQKLLEDVQRIYQLKSQVNARVFEELESQKLNLAQANQVCLSFQNQINQLGQQIQDLQKEKVNLEDKLRQDFQISNQQQQQQQQQLINQKQVSKVNPPKVQVQINQGKPQDQAFSGHTSKILSLVVSRDNQFIISGSGRPENSIKIWNFQEGTLHRTLQGHFSHVWSVVISMDQK